VIASQGNLLIMTSALVTSAFTVESKELSLVGIGGGATKPSLTLQAQITVKTGGTLSFIGVSMVGGSNSVPSWITVEKLAEVKISDCIASGL
jgi:hypothetical protein